MVHAIYPGTFDVLTHGHLDVIRRAANVFGKLTVAVADNAKKRANSLFTVEERLDMLRQGVAEFPNVETTTFRGLTVDFAHKLGATVLVRGLRVVTDFEFELNMAMTNGQLAPDIVTVFLAPPPQLVFVSSSLVKEVAAHGGPIDRFVPGFVETALRARLAQQA